VIRRIEPLDRVGADTLKQGRAGMKKDEKVAPGGLRGLKFDSCGQRLEDPCVTP
jgi:hypothetical protein